MTLAKAELHYIRTGLNRFCEVLRKKAEWGVNADMFEIKAKEGHILFECSATALLSCTTMINGLASESEEVRCNMPRRGLRIIQSYLKTQLIHLCNSTIPAHEERIRQGKDPKGNLNKYLEKYKETLTMLNAVLIKVERELK